MLKKKSQFAVFAFRHNKIVVNFFSFKLWKMTLRRYFDTVNYLQSSVYYVENYVCVYAWFELVLVKLLAAYECWDFNLLSQKSQWTSSSCNKIQNIESIERQCVCERWKVGWIKSTLSMAECWHSSCTLGKMKWIEPNKIRLIQCEAIHHMEFAQTKEPFLLISLSETN